MSENDEEVSDFEALTQQLRNAPGVVDHVAKAITDGIEMESFRDTPVGKMLIASAVESMVKSMEVILDPNTSGQHLLDAVAELRVRHRMLVVIDDTIKAGRGAAKRLAQSQEEPGL